MTLIRSYTEHVEDKGEKFLFEKYKFDVQVTLSTSSKDATLCDVWVTYESDHAIFLKVQGCFAELDFNL